MTWQTMETAPLDGTPVDLWMVGPHSGTEGYRTPDAYWGKGKEWTGVGGQQNTREVYGWHIIDPRGNEYNAGRNVGDCPLFWRLPPVRPGMSDGKSISVEDCIKQSAYFPTRLHLAIPRGSDADQRLQAELLARKMLRFGGNDWFVESLVNEPPYMEISRYVLIAVRYANEARIK